MSSQRCFYNSPAQLSLGPAIEEKRSLQCLLVTVIVEILQLPIHREEATSLCISILGIQTSTVLITSTAQTQITQTATATLTFVEVSTTVTTTVTTIPAAVARRAPGPEFEHQKRTFPQWLPYHSKKISQACACLSIPTPTTTSTVLQTSVQTILTTITASTATITTTTIVETS